jgi:hypothetical protein
MERLSNLGAGRDLNTGGDAIQDQTTQTWHCQRRDD